MRACFRLFCTLLVGLAVHDLASAGPLRERLQERREARAEAKNAEALPAGSSVRRDQPYGSDPLQRFDVYIPANAQGAPIIFMVHGGGWRTGDKDNDPVTENKAPYFLGKGYVFVSVNYRLLPTSPLDQTRDVAQALATVQRQAASWGADPARIVLMGHSAGAHLVSLLATDTGYSAGLVTTPWLGTVALDSAAFDVGAVMNARHLPLYDKAFGKDQALWKAASPYYAITSATRPLLAVCSTRRDDACAQANTFASKAKGLGVRVQVLPKDYSHRQINDLLGADQAYTAEIEAFLSSLGLK